MLGDSSTSEYQRRIISYFCKMHFLTARSEKTSIFQGKWNL